MKKSWMLMMFVLVLSALVLSACASKAGGSEEEDKPVPAEYTGKTNPFSGKADAADAGKQVYTDNCASCHGDGGKGDGPAGAALDPKPANLVQALSEDQDDRIFWVINEGGAPAGFSASMVSWKGTLSEDEIWQVVTYLRTLK
jgi:mono/diheme cytochrome c family protein